MANSSEDKKKAKNEKIEKDLQKRQESYDNKSKKLTQKYTFKSVIDKLKFETFTKRLVGVIVGVGLIDMQLSYILAFMDRCDIAESLSVQVCITVLGTALVYMIRAYFDTKAEKSDQRNTINNDAERDILNKVEEVFDNAGIPVPSDFEEFNTFKKHSEYNDEYIYIPIDDDDDLDFEVDESDGIDE